VRKATIGKIGGQRSGSQAEGAAVPFHALAHFLSLFLLLGAFLALSSHLIRIPPIVAHNLKTLLKVRLKTAFEVEGDRNVPAPLLCELEFMWLI
jgi:hypothetical protein